MADRSYSSVDNRHHWIRSVGTVSVVPLPTTGGLKTETVVKGKGSDVVVADFEGGVGRTVLSCPLQQR